MLARGAAADWLIVALGNPGREHEGTRHNVGFLVADRLAVQWGLGRQKERFKGRVAEGTARTGKEPPGAPASGPAVAVLWPQTYMNEVGRSASPARGSYRVALDHVLVLHDEIDLPFGDVRTRLGGGLAGHNGLKSLSRELGGPGFWRVRIGVGRPASTDPEIVSSYVLGRFAEPQTEVDDLIRRACDAAAQVISGEVH